MSDTHKRAGQDPALCQIGEWDKILHPVKQVNEVRSCILSDKCRWARQDPAFCQTQVRRDPASCQTQVNETRSCILSNTGEWDKILSLFFVLFLKYVLTVNVYSFTHVVLFIYYLCICFLVLRYNSIFRNKGSWHYWCHYLCHMYRSIIQTTCMNGCMWLHGQYPFLALSVHSPQMVWERMCASVCVCLCVCVDRINLNVSTVLTCPHIHSFRTMPVPYLPDTHTHARMHTHAHILTPFEDCKLTGLEVAIVTACSLHLCNGPQAWK